jgi:hypothetical protein
MTIVLGAMPEFDRQVSDESSSKNMTTLSVSLGAELRK